MYWLTSHRRFCRNLETRWPRLYRVAYSWCHDAPLAGDLVQDTLVKALAKRHQLVDDSGFDKWLFTILINTWRDHCRRKQTAADIDELSLVTDDTPEQHCSRSELIQYVRSALKSLSRAHREIITLVDLEAFSYEEVAQMLDLNIGTVRSRLHRARSALERRLAGLRLQDGARQGPVIRRIK